MILLKNTTNNQIFYIIHKKMYGKTDGYGLTTLDVEYTENGQYSVTPPSGYDGLSSVNVTVDVESGDCNLTTSTVTITEDGEHIITPPEGYDGFSEVVVNVESDCEDAYEEGIADQKAKLASATFTENGSYNREDGWNTVTVNVDTVTPYNEGVEDGKDAQKALMTSLTAVSNGTYTREDGYNEVVVNVPSDINNQNKQVTYTQNGTQTVTADNGYSGLGQVEVTVNVEPNLTTDTFTSNGIYAPVDYDGYSYVNVNVDTVTPYNNGKLAGIAEQKAKLVSGTFTQNGTFNREDGYNQVIVNVPSDINNQNKTVNPSTSSQSISADSGYSGLGTVTVNPVTSSIDNNILSTNIKKDVTILGITGTFNGDPNLQLKNVTPTTSAQMIRPDGGYDGLSEVDVAAVTSSIDANISAENIKKNITILGVTGSYDPQPNLQSKSVNPTTSAQTVSPDSGYDGLSQVSVAAVTSSIDANIQPENILSGVTILGVSGTDEGYDAGYTDGETAGHSAGYAEGEADGIIEGIAEQKAKLTSGTFVSNGTYTREDGYNEVIVSVPSDIHNQNKTVNPSTSSQSISADSGYSGLGTVTINAVTAAIDQNIQPENILSGVNILGVDGTNDGYDTGYDAGVADGYQSGYSEGHSDGWTEGHSAGYNEGEADGEYAQKAKLTSTTLTSNGTYTREDGWNSVTVAVPSSINNQNKTVNPATSQQSVTADSGYSGLGMVTVNAVTAAIDSNIQAENILSGVTILGVTGTDEGYDAGYSAGEADGEQAGYDTGYQTGYDEGYSAGQAECPTPTFEQLVETITENGSYSYSPEADGFDSVDITVNVHPNELLLSKYAIDVVSDGDFPAGGIEYPIGVYSTDTWNITSKPNWVTTDSNSGNAGVSLLTVTVNSVEDGRTGTITITKGTITRTITITQTDYSAKYLTLEVTSPGKLYWKQYGTNARVLQHSEDGVNWTNCTSSTADNGSLVANLSTGDKVMFRASTPSFTPDIDNYHSFVFVDGLKGNVYGNINSFSDPYNLFMFCRGVQSAEHLVVPEGSRCIGTFEGCTWLTTAPKSLPRGNYQNMFYGCTRLANAPKLPSTILSERCYDSMFTNCISITTAPELPATTLADYCYHQMFWNCTSLTTAPELPATTLAEGCYWSMFATCTNLTTAPELPATTLADECYSSMFAECTNLTNAPELPATTLAIGCYDSMFIGCTSLETAPDLPATTLAISCYSYMFKDCTDLNYVKAMFTTTPGSSYTNNWLNNVSATGTFVKNSAATWNVSGVNGIPDGWTVQTASE